MIEGEEEELEVAQPNEVEDGGGAEMEGGEAEGKGGEEVHYWEEREEPGGPARNLGGDLVAEDYRCGGD